MQQGVLLAAFGNSYTPGLGHSYGRWAFNMALSIKHFMPGLPIQLLHDRQAIADIKTNLFDHMTDITGVCEQSLSGQFEPSEIKLRLNHFSVFDQTMYLDVDGCLVDSLEDLFLSCSGKKFASQMTGFMQKESGHKTMLWCAASRLWPKYNLPDDAKMPATNTSWIYFNKSDLANKIFDDAYDLYRNNPVDVDELNKWGESHSQPDELYINLSCALNDYNCWMGFNPLYFRHCKDYTNPINLDVIKSKYYGIGCYGGKNYNHVAIELFYDELMSSYYRHAGLTYEHRFKYMIAKKFFQIVKPKTLTHEKV